jgi:hypothetical protein
MRVGIERTQDPSAYKKYCYNCGKQSKSSRDDKAASRFAERADNYNQAKCCWNTVPQSKLRTQAFVEGRIKNEGDYRCVGERNPAKV